MVMPAVRPLLPEAWDKFMEDLRRGPTPEQARALEKAEDLVRRRPARDASGMKIKTRRLRL